METKAFKGAILALFLCFLMTGIPLSLHVLDRLRPPEVRASELSYLPKGEYLKVAVLGFEHIVADLIWLKVVQHFGVRGQSLSGFQWAYHAVHVVTDLDPQFLKAYEIAGTVLGVWSGLVHESIDLLEKGMGHHPTVWQLPFLVGYEYFYELCDPLKGAQYFKRASELPGSPSYLASLAAKLEVEGGHPDAAVEFLLQFRSQVQDERVATALDQRLKEVLLERDIAFLEEGVRRYRVHYGKAPTTLGELVSRSIIEQMPEEPFGGEYLLDQSSLQVKSTVYTKRLKVYRKQTCGDLQKQYRRRVEGYDKRDRGGPTQQSIP